MDETTEEWRSIPGYEGRYSASTHGRIRREPAIIGSSPNPDGYLRSRISHGSLATTEYRLTHQVIAETFLGPRPPGMFTNHKDGDKLNNAPDNLEYVSSGDNTRHAHASGLCRRGERLHNAKFTEEEAQEILLSTETDAALATKYRVTTGAISHIRTRRNWPHLVGEAPPNRGRGELRKDARLNEEKVREIRASTESTRALAQRFGVTPTAIWEVKNRRTWKHVP